MGRMSTATRSRMVALSYTGLTVSIIQGQLLEEGIAVSKTSLCPLLKNYQEKGTVNDLWWYSHPTILTSAQLRFIDEELAAKSDLTSRQLHQCLLERFSFAPSISTVKRARQSLGWVCKKTRYSLIREQNREKRLQWCRERLECKDTFEDVIWSNECTIQIESCRAKSYHKVGQPAG